MQGLGSEEFRVRDLELRVAGSRLKSECERRREALEQLNPKPKHPKPPKKPPKPPPKPPNPLNPQTLNLNYQALNSYTR